MKELNYDLIKVPAKHFKYKITGCLHDLLIRILTRYIEKMLQMSDYVREGLYQAIYSLLGKGTIQERVSSANQYLIPVKFYEREIPEGILEEFEDILDYFNQIGANKIGGITSGQEEIDLTERLFAIYIIINSGNLIF